ncbi:MAG: hypothetical protein IIX45_04710, partial [Lachnospiraceae bacterium]|nr:hypothetical protein [Lachnospiraceae bacterium]
AAAFCSTVAVNRAAKPSPLTAACAIFAGDTLPPAMRACIRYSGTVNVKYEVPVYWKIAYIISLVTLIAIIVCVVYYKIQDIKAKK